MSHFTVSTWDSIPVLAGEVFVHPPGHLPPPFACLLLLDSIFAPNLIIQPRINARHYPLRPFYAEVSPLTGYPVTLGQGVTNVAPDLCLLNTIPGHRCSPFPRVVDTERSRIGRPHEPVSPFSRRAQLAQQIYKDSPRPLHPPFFSPSAFFIDLSR